MQKKIPAQYIRTEMKWDIIIHHRTKHRVELTLSDVYEHIGIGESLHESSTIVAHSIEERWTTICADWIITKVFFKDFFFGNWSDTIIIESIP